VKAPKEMFFFLRVSLLFQYIAEGFLSSREFRDGIDRWIEGWMD
jgi:hypothetical protein